MTKKHTTDLDNKKQMPNPEDVARELTDKLGYEPYEASGRNSGNSRNGYHESSMRTSGGESHVYRGSYDGTDFLYS